MTHLDFTTDRLSMQLITRAHAAEAHPLFQDPKLYTYIPNQPPTLEQLEKQYAFWENRDSPDGTEYWLNWSVFEISSQRLIGRVQAGITKATHEASVGYMIGSSSQGNGYGTEAVEGLIKHCHQQYAVPVFKAWIDTRNAASIRLVQKLWMRQVEFIEKADHFDGQDSDEFVFELNLNAQTDR